MQKYSKILSKLDVVAQLVYKTDANKVLNEFYTEEEKKTHSKKQPTKNISNNINKNNP